MASTTTSRARSARLRPPRRCRSRTSPTIAGPFDDIILLGPRSAEVASKAADALAYRGVMNLVADEPLDGPVELDIGRLHYHYTAYVGTKGTDVAAWHTARRRTARS